MESISKEFAAEIFNFVGIYWDSLNQYYYLMDSVVMEEYQ
jgi:hypothetical protein